MLQICLSGIWRAACDYSFGCSSDGRAACRQLGYSGSQISECTSVYQFVPYKPVATVGELTKYQSHMSEL